MRIHIANELRNNKFELLLIAPMALYIFCFTLGPVFFNIFLSFQDKFTHQFPTAANYHTIITHFQFIESLRNTILITLISLTLELSIGLYLALLLSKRFIGKGFLRALVILPLGVPTIVAASNMRYLFDTHGFLNEFLYRAGVLSLPVDWTAGGIKTILAIALSDTWKVTPLVMLVLLAGLESIPRQLYDAARIDGATEGQIFKKITLPLLQPFITIALIIRGIDAFRLFELPLTLAGTQTPVLSTYTYFEYFQFNNPYTSAASAVILLLIILAFAFGYVRHQGQNETLYQ